LHRSPPVAGVPLAVAHQEAFLKTHGPAAGQGAGQGYVPEECRVVSSPERFC
jgi:hypothetical protein